MNIASYGLPDNSIAWFKFYADQTVFKTDQQNELRVWSTTADGGSVLEVKIYPTGVKGEQGNQGE
jgi:hypothetical protein